MFITSILVILISARVFDIPPLIRYAVTIVAGSGLEFEDFGFYALKSIPDEHQLFRVTAV